VSSGRFVQVAGLLLILASDFYFLYSGAVRSGLILAQLMMILTVMILTYFRSKPKSPSKRQRTS
jgi:hypothetical protein